MLAYYNEFDPFAAAWLRNLIADGHIAAGDVDTRSITEVTPGDLVGYTQCHFFAGIGGWSYALRLAGWPDDRPVWTGSCPCQPFSAAGKGLGEADPRHLWPEFRRLITECRPAIVLGEQVASAAGRGWLAGVRTDLEGLGYAVGAADLCAASQGAPHIRQRLFWVADTRCEHRTGRRGFGDLDCTASDTQSETQEREWVRNSVGNSSAIGGLADAESSRSRPGLRESNPEQYGDGLGCGGRLGHPIESGLEGHTRNDDDRHQPGRLRADTAGSTPPASGPGRLADTDGGLSGDRELQPSGEHGQQSAHSSPRFWDAYDLLPCLDGKARRVEPGTFPLAHGAPARVGRLRGYGNAIVPQCAAAFVTAYLEAR